MYPPKTPLLPLPSTSRLTLRQTLLTFFRGAHHDPTLSPQIFDAWFFQLTGNERATVREILQALRDPGWPRDVQYPNVVALVHWVRERRGEGVGGQGEDGAEGVLEKEGEKEDGNVEVEVDMQGLEEALGNTDTEDENEDEDQDQEEELRDQQDEQRAQDVDQQRPHAGPVCPGRIFQGPQPSLLHGPEAMPMRVLAFLVLVFAPAWLVRVLLVLCVLRECFE